MDGFETISDILPYLIPLLILELGLLIFALVDLLNRQKVRGDKLLWVLLIVVIGIIGSIIYYIFGRQKDTVKTEE
ncbi:MAG: PLDc N-terminal domain-containing protein [Dehalococcoidales bacterium]|nr:PLDc N-terminal domain-containing protein [Dehalococcoidales bacterium]